MADLENIKKSRAAAKRKVNITMKKLQGALQRGSPDDELIDLSKTLEADFYFLNDLHLQFLEIDDSDIDYLVEIENSYKELMNTCHASLKSSDDIRKQKEAVPLHRTIERGFTSVENVLSVLDDRMSGQDKDVIELGILREELDGSLNNLLENITKLAILEDTHNLDSRADDLVTRSETTKRKVNLSIKRAHSEVFSQSHLVEVSSVVSQKSTESEGSISTFPSTAGEVCIQTVPSTSGEVCIQTSPSTADQGSISTVKSTVSQDSKTIPAVGCLSQPIGFNPSAQSIATSTQFTLNHRLDPMATPYTSSSLNPSSNNLVLDTCGNVITNALHSQPLMTHGFVPHSTTAFHPPTFPQVTSYSAMNYLYATPEQWHNPTGSFYPSTHPNLACYSSSSPGTYQRAETIHTKKPSLPTFSGDRGDWPEFKCVWKVLAEAQFTNKMQLATELKRACIKGRAKERVKHVYVTSDEAYEEMWRRLSEEYDDPGLSVQAALEKLAVLKKVDEMDYRGLVRLIDEVEGVYNQLKELNLLEAIHMADVDRIGMLLPNGIHMDWIRRYKDLSLDAKTKPFPEFVRYLIRERAAASRMAESQVVRKPRTREDLRAKHSAGSHAVQGGGNQDKVGTSYGDHGKGLTGKEGSCVVHEEAKHRTADCRNFKGLPMKQKLEVLRKKRCCFKCFAQHPRAQCKAPPCSCGKDHHVLLCSAQQPQPHESSKHVVEPETYLVNSGGLALYPIHNGHVVGGGKPITIFMDGGSNASYITESCASRVGLKRVQNVKLDVTTVGGQQREFKSAIYEVPLRTQNGRMVKVLAYGLPEITGHLAPLDRGVLRSLFPGYDIDAVMRKSKSVDLLIGTDYYGLHPKAELAKAGANLSIMQGELGICVVGTHPQLKEETVMSEALPISVNGSVARVGLQSHHSTIKFKI